MIHPSVFRLSITVIAGLVLGLVLFGASLAYGGVVPLLRDPNNALVEAQADSAKNQKVVIGGAEDSGNITTTTCALEPDTGCRVVTMPGSGNTWTVAITGTWVATLQFEGTIDGTNWFAVGLRPADNFEAGTAVSSTTANGVWKGNAGGFVKVRVRASAFTSGTAAVTQRISHATGAVVATGVSVSGSVSQGASGNANDGWVIRASDGSNKVNVGDNANSALRVNVVAGSSSGTAAYEQSGGTDQSARVFDTDTGAGSEFTAGVELRKAASGGSVAFGTSTDPIRTDPTGTTAQPVTDNGGSLTVDGTVSISGTPTVAISQTTTANDVDATIVNTPNVAVTSFPDNEPINISQWGGSAPGAGNPVHVAPGGGAIFNVDTTTADEVTASINQTGTANDVDIASSVTLNVNCTSGCSSTPSTEDQDAFTVGTTAVAVIAGQRDDTSPDQIAEGEVGGVRMTADRAIHVAQQGEVTVAQGAVAANAGGSWWVKLSDGTEGAEVTAANALKVDGSAVTQPVSGAVTVSDGSGDLTVDGTVTVQTLSQADNSAVEPIAGVGALYDTTPPSITDGNVGLPRMSSNRFLITELGASIPAGDFNIGNVDIVTMPEVAISQTGSANDVDANITALPNEGQQTMANSVSVAIASNQSAVPVSDNGGSLTVDGTVGVSGTVTVSDGSGAMNVIVDSSAAIDVNTTSADQMTVIPAGNGIACPSYVAISQTADTQLVAGNTGEVFFICAIHIIAAAAEVVSLWEGTGTACGTGSAAIIGSTTEANGVSLAANGGFAMGGGVPFLRTATTANALCLRQSGTSRVSGFISYRRVAP